MKADTTSNYAPSHDPHAYLRTGCLTPQKLLLWVYENNFEHPWNSSLPVTIDHCDVALTEETDRLWREMSEHEDFVQIFLKLPKPIQNWEVYQITNYMPAETLVDAHLLDLTLVKIRSDTGSNTELLSRSDKLTGYPIAEYEFLHYQSRFQSNLKSNWTEFNKVVIEKLKIIYGATVVVDAVRLWIDAKESRDLSIFIHLVRNWSKWKDFPLGWTIKVMDKPSERREGKWSIEELLT